MPVIEHSVVINRPVEEVFNYVTDFRNDPKWQPDVVDVRQSETKARVGTMITEKRRLNVLLYHLDLNVDVIDYKLNRRIEYKGVCGSFPFVGSCAFEPSGRSTKITETLDIHMWGPHRLFSGILAGKIRRRAAGVWDNLKVMLEKREG